VQSQHGHGVLTVHAGYQFETEDPYALWLERVTTLAFTRGRASPPIMAQAKH
jgi:hypothetical protein